VLHNIGRSFLRISDTLNFVPILSNNFCTSAIGKSFFKLMLKSKYSTTVERRLIEANHKSLIRSLIEV